MEIWKQIKDYPRFEVSNFGRIRIDGEKVRTWSVDLDWYVAIRLRNEHRTKIRPVHCLVMETFAPTDKPGMEVNHKDCRKSNNYLDNLEYVSHADNMKHAIESGRMEFRKRKGKDHPLYGRNIPDKAKENMKAAHNRNGDHPNYVLTDEQVKEIKKRRFNGELIPVLAREYNQTKANISLICLGKRRKDIAPEYTVKPKVSRKAKRRNNPDELYIYQLNLS